MYRLHGILAGLFIVLSGMAISACSNVDMETPQGLYSAEDVWHCEIFEDEGIFSEDEKNLGCVYVMQKLKVKAGKAKGEWVLSYKSELGREGTLHLREGERNGKEIMLRIDRADVLEKIAEEVGEYDLNIHLQAEEGLDGMVEYEGKDGVKYDGVYNTETGVMTLGYVLTGEMRLTLLGYTQAFPAQGGSSITLTKFAN
ncbi:MAG: hypothetical protein CSA97_02225 [Bacteroidetes bacterium]|nr:MAG: hypothetical protein CSA97_02225 [Bacteroidota bacterium]